MVKKQSVELYIEELVLHGFSSYNSYRIGEALQLELTRLLQEQGLPADFAVDADYGRLNAGTFNLQTDAKTETIGSNIANSVYKGFTK